MLKSIKNKNISWPNYDETILIEDTIKVVIQINGKRGLVESNQIYQKKID